MTLDEMANFICGKVNQTEAEDINACKGFLKRRHEMIWAEALWKDSLVEYRQTLSPTGYTLTSSWLPTKGVLLLPSIIERVIAVRSDTRKLNIQRPEIFYRVDYDAFAKTGEAADYTLLPKCVWETDRSVKWRFYGATAPGDTAAVLLDYLGTDGVSVQRTSFQLGQDAVEIATSDRVDSVLKAATANAVRIVASENVAGVLIRNTSSHTAEFGTSESPALSSPYVYGSVIGGATGELAVSHPRMAYFYADPLLTAHGPTLTVANSSGPAFTGVITYNGTTLTLQADVTPVSIAASDTFAALRQRVRLIEIPTAELTLRVLGKRSAPTFENDLDRPGLTGSQNCLIAFCQGDMLERGRQYAKANAKFQEGLLLLEQLKQVETVQQSHNCRIIPEGGYGWDDGWPNDGKANW